MKKYSTNRITESRQSLFSILVSSLIVSTFLVTPGSVAAAINLVPNANLEIIDAADVNLPQDWFPGSPFINATSTYVYPVADATDGHAAQVTIESTNAEADAKWYFTEVPIIGNKEYTFTDEYTSTSNTEIVLKFSDINKEHLSYGGFKSVTPTAPGEWAKASLTFTAPFRASYVTVYHRILNGTLTVDNYSLVKDSVDSSPFEKGIITFSFDDGWSSQYTNAVPMLSAANIPASFHIITSETEGDDSYYMSSTTIRRLQEQGFEVGSHTVNHCNLKTGRCPDGTPANKLDPLTVEEELTQSKLALEELGIRTVDTFVYPYGAYKNNQTLSQVSAAGYIAARTTEEGFNDKSSNPLTLKTQYINLAITDTPDGLQNLKEMIDAAIVNKEWLILMVHQVESLEALTADPDYLLTDGTTPEFLQQIINYVQEKRDLNTVVVKNLREVILDCMSNDESNCVNTGIVMPDTTAPTITINPYISTLTNQDVLVTASTNEGTLNTTSHTFTANGTFDFIATDTSGNQTTETITISNIDRIAPVISLVGNNPLVVTLGTRYVDAGASARDDIDGDISGSIIKSSDVDTTTAGSYSVTYDVSDAAGNIAAPVSRIITVSRPNSSSGGGGGGSSSKISTLLPVAQGEVLGEATSTEIQVGGIDIATSPRYIFLNTIGLGSAGFDVVELQKRLTEEGVYTGPITGYFGPLTSAGVRAFQAKNGIEQAGLLGPKTRELLNRSSLTLEEMIVLLAKLQAMLADLLAKNPIQG